MKIVDRIDIDKENENLEQLRRNNSNMGLPSKDKERGFCTKCLIF